MSRKKSTEHNFFLTYICCYYNFCDKHSLTRPTEFKEKIFCRLFSLGDCRYCCLFFHSMDPKTSLKVTLKPTVILLKTKVRINIVFRLIDIAIVALKLQYSRQTRITWNKNNITYSLKWNKFNENCMRKRALEKCLTTESWIRKTLKYVLT